VILAARKMGGPYGGIVELLALTGQRRGEVAGLTWQELNLEQRVWTIPKSRTKNAKAHVVHLSEQSMAALRRADQRGSLVFSLLGTKPFQEFSRAKVLLDQLSGVGGWRLHDLRRTLASGMARLAVAPHVADKILNHQAGTISGVAAVYQRHEFLAEREQALDIWGAHIGKLLNYANARTELKITPDALTNPGAPRPLTRPFELAGSGTVHFERALWLADVPFICGSSWPASEQQKEAGARFRANHHSDVDGALGHPTCP